jgi:hypothetical protein
MNNELPSEKNVVEAGHEADMLRELFNRINHRSSGRRFDTFHLFEDQPVEVTLAIARVSVSDPAWLVRCEAAEYLADYGTSLDKYRIRLLLKDPSWLVRSSAVEAVQQVFGKKGEASLIPMLEDWHPIVRRDAALCLGEMGLKSSIPHLQRRLLSESTDQARNGICTGLILLGEREFLGPLLDLTATITPQIVISVWKSVDEIVHHSPVNEREREMIMVAIHSARLRPEVATSTGAIEDLQDILTKIETAL